MKQALIAAVLLLPAIAAAQTPGQSSDKAQLDLIPHEIVAAAAGWILQPDAASAVKLWLLLNACAQDNPSPSGVITRAGPDQCGAVTEKIAERDKELADLNAKITERDKELTDLRAKLAAKDGLSIQVAPKPSPTAPN